MNLLCFNNNKIINILKCTMRSIFIATLLLPIITALRDAKYCPAKCECKVDLDSVYDKCPLLTVEHSIFDEYIRIKCNSLNEAPYLQLPKYRVESKHMQFDECPLPDQITFRSIFENFNTTIHSLRLSNAYMFNHSLKQNHFKGLDDLLALSIYNNGGLDLPGDLFFYFKKLISLRIRDNQIFKLPSGIFSNLKFLQRLVFRNNSLMVIQPDLFHFENDLRHLDLRMNKLNYLAPHTFDQLQVLEILAISENCFDNFEWSVFSKLINIKNLGLGNHSFSSLPDDLFFENKELEELYLGDNTASVLMIPPRMFARHIELKVLSIINCGMKTLNENLFVHQNQLEKLRLSFNQIIEIPNRLFHGTYNLVELDLSENYISEITEFHFSNLSRISTLNLENNNIKVIDRLAFSGTSRLEYIFLQNNLINMEVNDILRFCDISKLDLQNNSIDKISLDLIFSRDGAKFSEIDLSFNRITLVNFTQVQFLHANRVSYHVNLTFNYIKEIVLLENYLKRSSKECSGRITIDLNNNPIHCDCRIVELKNLLEKYKYSECFIETENLLCASPIEMVGKISSNINSNDPCEMYFPNSYAEHCPNNCTCLLRSFYSILIVNCSNWQHTSIPSLYLKTANLSSLQSIEFYMQNNLLSILPDLTRTLIYHNDTNSSAIQSNLLENTKLWLSGNPWQCDCNFVTNLEKIAHIITDYSDLRCDDGLKIPDNLCTDVQQIINMISIVLGCLGFLIAMTVGLYYTYQLELKIWLYTNKWCLWFVDEVELDKDKVYDAFVSYSHKDIKLITEHIIPELENTEPHFKLCLHERDWMVGDLITDSIYRSINESRRTIVILSQNFLDSVWGNLEFQIAHQNAMLEKRIRVIIVIYGDIGDVEKLDLALKTYLKTNTYIKWDDPWFWNRLRYSLPHRTSTDDLQVEVQPTTSLPQGYQDTQL